MIAHVGCGRNPAGFREYYKAWVKFTKNWGDLRGGANYHGSAISDVSPYAGLQLSWLNQKSYTENGAGIFNQHVAGKHNTYFAGQLGVELKRYLPRGSYGLRLGVKHAFAGADPELSFRYEGNNGKAYTLRNSQDKTHFLLSLSGETEFAKGWFLNGEAQLQKGAHDKDISASLQFKRMW